MCGIVGFIDKNKNLEILSNMLEVQLHRGPDDSGVYFDEKSGVNLGHNRLSVQDLSSKGRQPFISDCGNFVIVFNGEVYNFKDIRKELINLGYKFVSNTDTEVVLYSYKEWGMKCLQKFIGMFAFCILDKIENKLTIVRDRAGVKPLYYYTDGKEFIFSSEIKSFHKHPKFKKEQNIDVLPYYFQFGYIPAPHTIFNNCFKLEPGHYLEVNIESLKSTIIKYWDVNDFYLKEKVKKNENDILREIEELLENAIELRMISDVPVGVFLSGGYDSSLVASILCKKLKKKINTFTIGFDDEKYNEAAQARSIANYLDTNHKEYYMRENDVLDLVADLPYYYDEPFGDSSALPTMILSKLARENVTVALSADGGDETFVGYSKYFFLNELQNVFSNKFKKNFLQLFLNLFNTQIIDYINSKLPERFKQRNIKDKYQKFSRALSSSNLQDMFENASSYTDKKEIAEFLKVDCDQEIYKKWEKNDNIDFLDYMMATDYKLFMNDDILTKVDRATMSVNLEGREPLLDHRLIEYMAGIPLEIKYKEKQGKYILKKVVNKFIPKDMIEKPKSGFQVPLNEWLRSKLKPIVLEYLDETKLDANIFDLHQISLLKERFFQGEDLGTAIWFILVYQMWKERWLV